MKFRHVLPIALLLVSMGTIAKADDVRVSVNRTDITVQINTKENIKANIIVSKKGEDIDDNDSIYEMIQVTSDENGKIVHNFTIEEERDGVSNYGEYEVFVKPFGEAVLKGEFSFVTERDVERLMAALRADDADFAAIFDADSEYRLSLKSIGCTMDMYDSLENPERAATLFAGAFKKTMEKGSIVLYDI